MTSFTSSSMQNDLRQAVPHPRGNVDGRREARRWLRHEVTDADTAEALGSGDVAVLATPRLIQWMEAATLPSAALFIDRGQTTVGTAVRIEHFRAVRPGDTVEVFAEPSAATRGRRLTFTVWALGSSDDVVAVGEIDRAIVDRDRFLGSAGTRN